MGQALRRVCKSPALRAPRLVPPVQSQLQQSEGDISLGSWVVARSIFFTVARTRAHELSKLADMLAERVAAGGSERRQLGPGGPEWLPP